jgi:hypothetical protein
MGNQILPKAFFHQPMTSVGRSRFLVGTIVCFLLLISFYVVLVGTDWGHQLDDDAFLGRGAISRQVVRVDSALLMRVSTGTIMIAAVVLLLISVVRRRALVGVLAIAGFFAAVAGAEILKDFVFPWRALVPDDARLGQDFQGNTYPSGHATIATAFLLSLLLVSPPRWRWWLTAIAGAAGTIFTAGVLFAGWHRASDALGALAWSGFCMNLAAAAAVRFRGRPAIDGARHGSSAGIVAGVVMLLSFFLIVGTAAPQYPHRDLPFLLVSAAIIAGSFALPIWYSRELQTVEFLKGTDSVVRGER